MAAVDYRLEAPELIRDFLQYHETIKNHSTRTVDAYYIDLRLFLRFVKWNRELVPQDTPLLTSQSAMSIWILSVP